MPSHHAPDLALRDHCRALREQSTHEDHRVAHRMDCRIGPEGRMFAGSGAHARDGVCWLVPGNGTPARGLLTESHP